MRNDADAEDAVQDACLRALRFFVGLRGGDGRVWSLANRAQHLLLEA
jgi:DNA-directed RNA polymerase specialized sigma24 family protein